jgi:hypothetical protein
MDCLPACDGDTIREMGKHQEPSSPAMVLREKLKELEAQLRQRAADLERLANRVGEPDGILGTALSPAEVEAVSLAIVYASANVALANAGSATGSIEPDRN